MSRYRSGVRIIGGHWKGRRIPVPNLKGLRPTSDRIRETLFNWLQPYVGLANCLDLFAGSGVLALEALSRGASLAVAVDKQRQAVDTLIQTRALLGANSLKIVHDTAERTLSNPPEFQFDIVFIDPPFDLSLHRPVLQLLQENSWLSPNALIYIESSKGDEVDCCSDWVQLKHGIAGNVDYRLLQAAVSSSSPGH